MTSRPSATRQRSLFCKCNRTPCQCRPTTTRTSTRHRTQSWSRLQAPEVATIWPHYDIAPTQQLPSTHAPSGAYVSSFVGSHHSPNSTSRSTRPNQIQLHALLKAPSILRTPESPTTFRIQWDVRDPTTIVTRSNHGPRHLYEHPASVAYATNPPVPFLMIACNDGLPWLTPVHARPGSAGVTVWDVLEAISSVLYTQVDERTLWQLPNDEARKRVYHAYYRRIERNDADERGILTVDLLGKKTLFVCLERDEALARKHVKDKNLWPYVFGLKLKMNALVSDV